MLLRVLCAASLDLDGEIGSIVGVHNRKSYAIRRTIAITLDLDLLILQKIYGITITGNFIHPQLKY